MNFLAPLALLLGLLVVLPVLAHSLRKGKTTPLTFPAARLVPARSSSSKKRNRLEDRALLALRSLLMVFLALLAASPLVTCSRLSLGRKDGASVSAALVIDDSASMRARDGSGTTRLQKALEAAQQLVRTSQSGDAFSIVLAGAPPRIVTPSTTDRASVREALAGITESDRDTDLAGALALSRSIQSDSVHAQRPIVLLSDLAVSDLDRLDLNEVVVPDAGLRGSLQNCAALQATKAVDSIQVELACTSAESLVGRHVELTDNEGNPVGKPEPARDGIVTLELPPDQRDKNAHELSAQLSSPQEKGWDQIPDDDSCPVLDATAKLTVAVRADQGSAGLKTGAGTVLQAGIESLDRGVRVETLSLLPDQIEDLKDYAAVLIDDPSGFTPEVGQALERWMESGGVGIAFLGPNLRRTPLGSGFLPFISGALRWESNPSSGADPKVPGNMGPLSTTWADLAAADRVILEEQPSARTLATFQDGRPLVLEKSLGRGLALSATLPSSVDLSDLALRPAFLELLDYVISESALRKGARATPVGQRWIVEESTQVVAPDGRNLEKKRVLGSLDPSERFVEPDLAGRYRVVDGQGTSHRYATRYPLEHVQSSPTAIGERGIVPQGFQLSEVGISREVALIVLVLSFLELLIRLVRRPRRQETAEKLSEKGRKPAGRSGSGGLQSAPH